jgi:integrase/recombinase XerD
MRISEVVNLKKENIDFENEKIYIVNSKRAKSRKIYMPETIKAELQKIVNKTDGESAFGIDKGYIKYTFYKIKHELRYKKSNMYISPHTLRRSGARHLYDNGWQLKELMKILGHTDIQTTQRYINFDEDELQEKFKKVEYNFGG